MLKKMNTSLVGSGSLLLALMLSACGSLSKVDQQGRTDSVVWPKPQDVTFNTGSYPRVDSLRKVGSGMTKDQLYDLLGRPHFNEGLVGVHEWDYLFHFRTPSGDLTCQYKVLFDKDRLARSFYWAPESCADVLKDPAPVKAVAAEPPPVVQVPVPIKTFSLNSDVLFAFGSAALTVAGKQEVDRVGAMLRDPSTGTVAIVGHTDRVGSDASNLALSERRANAVRDQLARSGVANNRMGARGVGESQPVAQCNAQSQAELIACLAPNRRVDIRVPAQL